MNIQAIRIWGVIALLTLLTACQAPSVRPVDPALNDANSADVHFYRVKGFVNGGVDYRVFAGNEYIGTLSNGSQFIRRLPNGSQSIIFKPYEFGIPSLGEKRVEIELKAGQNYYLRMSHSVGGVVPIGSSMLISKSTGLNLVSYEDWKARR